MKRIICLLLFLTLLTGTVSAYTEGKRCEINAVIQAREQEIPVSLNIRTEEDRICLISSLIPDTCLQFSGINPGQAGDAAAEMVRILNDSRTGAVINQCAAEWFAYMQPEIRSGSFSGDAFEYASAMRHITFSCGDLLLLGERIRKALAEEGISPALSGGDWSWIPAPERNIRFDLKVFDDGKYASLNVLDGEDAVMTASVNLSDPDCILLITGVGTGGKNYYSRILAEKKEGRFDITQMLYADDLKAGYPGLREDSLIFTLNSTVEWDNEEIRLSGNLFPANDQVTPIACSGILRKMASGRILEGEVHFSGFEGFRTVFTADLYNVETGEMPSRIIDLEKAGEQELIALGTEIGVAFIPVLAGIISALPPEYAGQISQLLGF